MTVKEFLKAIMDERGDLPVQLHGYWNGTVSDLLQLNIPVSSVIYDMQEGIHFYITGGENNE